MKFFDDFSLQFYTFWCKSCVETLISLITISSKLWWKLSISRPLIRTVIVMLLISMMTFLFETLEFHVYQCVPLTILLWIPCRILNVQVGETSRLAWIGAEADPLVQSDNLLKAYNRPSEDVATTSSSSKWFISKKTLVSGLGLLGIKQGNADSVDGEAPSAPKARRKRVVRKKVSAS